MFAYYYINFSKSVIFYKPAYCLSSGRPACSRWQFTFKDPKCNQVPVFLSDPEILRDQGQMHWVIFQLQDQEIANEKRHFKNHPTQFMYFTGRGGKETHRGEVTHPRSHAAGGRVWTEAQPLNSSTLWPLIKFSQWRFYSIYYLYPAYFKKDLEPAALWFTLLWTQYRSLDPAWFKWSVFF